MTLAAVPVAAAANEADRPTDAALLAAVAGRGDRAAMDQLVRRYVDFVYAAAVRRLGDRHAAEDVVQTVFLVLARKAGVVQAGALPTWLHRTTQYTAANAERAARRRRRHERRAARAEAVMPDVPDDADTLRPLLDAAIDTLGRRDRQAVVERYLLGRDFAAVGETLGLSAGSAQKCVERAVGKLRRQLLRAGVPASAVALAAALSAAAPSPAMAAPPAVVASLAQSLTAGSTSPLTAITAKGVLAMTVGTKLKIAAAAAVVVLLGGGAGVMILRNDGVATPGGATHPAAVIVSPASQPLGLLATLADGTRAEVGAIGDHESDTWWTPDGRPTERPIPTNVGRRTRPAPAGKRWVWVVWRVERPGILKLDATAYPEPIVNSSSSTTVVGSRGEQWSAELIAVDAGRTTLNWRVMAASKPAEQVVLDRPADGVWAADTSVTRVVPGFGRVSIRNPREMRFAYRPGGYGAAFDSVVPQNGDSTNWNMTLADVAGRTNWENTDDPPTNVDDVKTRAASVPLNDVARVTLTLTRYDEWVHFHDLPLRPDVPTAARTETHDPPVAVPAGAKLAPFADLRFVGDVPQVLVNDIWWEWVTLDHRPIGEVIADAKRLDARQWQKRLGEDLVDVMTAGGIVVGPTVSLGLRTLDGTGTSTTDVPMTSENRRLVRERRAQRERVGEGPR